ncbi:hypothetical protein D3C78_1293980 [compost metagenome]
MALAGPESRAGREEIGRGQRLRPGLRIMAGYAFFRSADRCSAARVHPRLSCLLARVHAARGDHARHAAAPGHHRLRRDRLGQDHAAAQDRAGAGARQVQRPGRQPGQAHRPHPAAAYRRELGGQAHCRGAQDAAGRRGRLQGAFPGPAVQGQLGQADDRRHPAGRDPDRSAAQGL